MYRSLGAAGTTAINTELVLSALAHDDKDAVLAESARLSASERAALIREALDALPDCYGSRTHGCVWGDAQSSWPWSRSRCESIALGYLGDWDTMDAAIQKLPYCDETGSWIYGVAGILGGIAATTLLLAALKKP